MSVITSIVNEGTPRKPTRHALFIALLVCVAVYMIIFNFGLPVTVNDRLYSWVNSGVKGSNSSFFSRHTTDEPELFDVVQWIPECNCSRPVFYSKSRKSSSYYNLLFLTNLINYSKTKIKSSCSDEGTSYTSNQNVISFSMYFPPSDASSNSKSFYATGITKNLEEMRKFYPGYSMRVYTNTPLVVSKDQQWCHLICNNSDLFWCNIEKTPTLGNRSHMNFMIWRFLPLGDPSVDVFLSRDLDSVVTEREAAAVRDWLALPEKKAIQLMRDKSGAHYAFILGGMWGARNSYFGKAKNESVNSLLLNILKDSDNTMLISGRGFDQNVLYNQMYDPRRNQIVAYDSYTCKQFSKETLVKPFPIQRKNAVNDFVGNPALGQGKYQLMKCPVECRPSYGKHWEFC